MNKIILFLITFLISGFCFANEALPYNFSNTDFLTIRLSPIARIATDGEFYEGQEVKFKVRNNIYH